MEDKMSERHIKMCESVISWDRNGRAVNRDREREMYQAHPPELLLAMHEVLTALLDIEQIKPHSAKVRLDESVVRYEELTEW